MYKIITKCKITRGRFINVISAEYSDGSADDCIGSYYPDELYFAEREFIGLTKEEASELIRLRDVAYLRR